MDVQGFAAEANKKLGDRLVALYQYGSNFARGQKAPDAHLLLLVSNLEPALLDEVRPLGKLAREANVRVRFDTRDIVARSADVFPIFTLEFLETRSLLLGDDVLADLEVRPDYLRLRVEQSLRSAYRDLFSAYAESEDETSLVPHLRRAVRKSVYLLRAIGLVCKVELPDVPPVAQLIDEVIGTILPESDRSVWHRLRRMANFEEPVPPDGLVSLYGDALRAVAELIGAVDGLPAVTPEAG